MSLTGDYLSAADALRAGLVTEVVPHDELLPTARRVAASIVGNNQKAVRALLASYHRIDAEQTDAGLWIEATSAKQWMSSATGDDIAANRDAVLRTGPGAGALNVSHEYCGAMSERGDRARRSLP